MTDYNLFAIHCDGNNTQENILICKNYAKLLRNMIDLLEKSQINLAIDYAISRRREARSNSPAKSDVIQIHHGDQLRGLSEPRRRFMVIRKLSSARQVVHRSPSSASFDLELVTSRLFLFHVVFIDFIRMTSWRIRACFAY